MQIRTADSRQSDPYQGFTDFCAGTFDFFHTNIVFSVKDVCFWIPAIDHAQGIEIALGVRRVLIRKIRQFSSRKFRQYFELLCDLKRSARTIFLIKEHECGELISVVFLSTSYRNLKHMNQ